MSEVKPFWKSKTIWFNVLAVIVVIAGIVGFDEFTPDPQLLSLAAVIGNIILRFATGQPIVLDETE